MDLNKVRMLSLNPRVIRTFCLLFCLLLSLIKLQSQCNPPDQLPTVQCINAPLTCLQDACYSTSNEQDQGWNGFCGNNTAIHNPQYFEVVPIADCIQINIHVDGCSSGAQLQAALVTSCQWQPCPGGVVPCADVLDCDPNTPVGGTMVIDACGLTPGVSLWLLIDGSSGAQCQYTIEYAQGIYEPLITEELTSGGASPTSVCQGYDDLFMQVGPSITNAHGYIWNLEWTGSFITSTLPETTVEIGDNVPEGTYQVCVLAFSGCDTTDIPFCFDVEVYEIPDEVKEPAIFCPEEFPFTWHTQTIDGPDEYFESFEDADGCKFDSSWVVEEYPEVPIGELDTLFCMNENLDPFFYEGEEYPMAGIYDLIYPNMGLNGCDSMAQLNLTLAGIDAFIEHTCENGEFVIEAFIQELIPANADLSFQWVVDGVISPMQENPLRIICDGTSVIELSITVETDAGSCVFDLVPYTLNCTADKPFAPELAHGDTLLCAQEGIIFCAIEDPFEPPLFFTWSGPPGVEVYDDGSGCVEMDFSFTQGGQVCVYAENECGEGPSTCFNVEIIDAPVASFNSVQDVCLGESTVISFTGSGQNPIFVWDFDNPASVTGSGAGPYTVSWNIVGDKVINLMVIEPGCDTAFASGIITVHNLQTPDVNCSSTINSVSFDWDDVAGSNGYLVSINGGAPIATPNSLHNITGLPPGTQINLELTIVSGGPCPNIVLLDTCYAVNCPAPTIVLSGPNSLCLNAPSVVTLEAEVNGAPGTGVWTGPGIIDGNAGSFDPKVSGSGQHQVMYTVLENGCSFDESYIVTVYDSITADFTIDPLICIDDVANLSYTGNASPIGATFDYDFGAATVVSGSGAGPYQLSFNTPGSKSVRLQVSANGCFSDVITQSLLVEATLTAPVVSCSSSTSGVTFSWTNTPDGFQYNVLSGQTPVEVSPTEIQFSGLVPGNIVDLEIISLTSGPCPIRKDTFSCEARDCPPVVLDLKPISDICLYPGTGTVDLEVTVTGGAGSGSWSGPGVTNDKFNPATAGPGSHDVAFHYIDDGCDFIESITINVYEPPTAFISNTSLILTCAGGNMLNLDGSGSSGSNLTYSWSTDDGAFLGITNQDNVDVGAPGTYQLKVTDSPSGCVDSMSVTVVQDVGIPDACAGPDRVITCDSTSFILGGCSSQGANLAYAWTTTTGNIVGGTDGISVVADKVGVYTITVRDNSNGCQSIDAVTITIDTAVASISLTPGDTIDCNTTLSDVTSTIGAPVTDYDLLWTTPDGTISGSPTGQDIDVSQGGTYVLTITNKDNGCSRSSSAFVAESDEIIDAVDVTQTNVVCFGDQNGTLTVNDVIGGSPNYDYAWSGSHGVGTSLSSLGPGQYTLTVTDANGCSFVQSFTITEPPKITADLGPNFTVAAMDSVEINLTTNLNADAISNIDWSGYAGINCPGCPSVQFIASQSGTIIALVTDTAGCDAIDSMRLTVIVPRITFIPTVFSPNGDNKNDYFFISGRFNLINIGYLRIFDRWGNQVFDKTDITPGVESEGWDGTYKDQPLQPGVYVYTARLDYEDLQEVVTGSITIIR